MEDFPLWQSKMASREEHDDAETVLFLAYMPASESQAHAAGLEFVGTTWDANGIKVKAYKQASNTVRIYRCVACGRQSRLDQGMYCCGKKRVLSL